MNRRQRPRVTATMSLSAFLLAGLAIPVGVAAEEAPSGLVGPQSASNSTVGYWDAVQRVGSSGSSQIRASAVTLDDTVVITGSFSGTTYFPSGPGDDSIALTSRGGNDIFIAALNSDNSYFAWAQRAGGTGTEIGHSVSLTADDTVVVTGSIGGIAYFPTGPGDDSIALTSSGGNDIFVAALNSDNSYFAWAQRAGGSGAFPVGSDVAYSVVLTSDDTPMISGSFTGTAYFPTGPGDDSIALTSPGPYSDIFVAAINADDSYFSWAQRAGGGIGDAAQGMALTGDDTAVLTGYFEGTAYFPTGQGDDSVALTATASGRDLFVAAMSADDTYFVWAQRAGGTDGAQGDQGYSIAVTSDDTVMVTGVITDNAYFPTGPGDDSLALSSTGLDIFVAAMSSDDSYFAWAQMAGSTGDSKGYSLAVSSDDTVALTGEFQGTGYFPTSSEDSIALTATGQRDIFVSVMNPDDTYFAWAQRAGGTGTDFGYSVTWPGTDTVLAGGSFNTVASFPSGPSTDISLTSLGATNAFLGWLSARSNPTPTPDPPAPATYPPSAPRDASAVPGDSSATVTWSPPASSGSFPITNYQVTSSPGGKTCLVTTPATSCAIDGLTNGVAYTFTVRALNGAGWSADSAPSAPVTPKAPSKPTIVITGSREASDRGAGRAVVNGITTKLAGKVVQAHLRFAGQADYTDGATRRVSDNETFTWKRKTNRKLYVYFTTEDRAVRSNGLIIKP